MSTVHVDSAKAKQAGVAVGVMLLLFLVFKFSGDARAFSADFSPHITLESLPSYEQSRCMADVMKQNSRIQDLIEAVQHWESCTSAEDRQYLAAFNRLYTLNVRHARQMAFSPEVAETAKRWVGAANYDELQHQRILSVMNHNTFEHTLYNPIRAKRPGANAASNNDEYIEGLVREELGDSCDFCHYETRTAREADFARVVGEHAATGSNVFKYDSWHGLVMFRNPHPLQMEAAHVRDMLRVAQHWFLRCHEVDASARFPHLYWDQLGKASASQLAKHAQSSLSPFSYYGMGEQLLATARSYGARHGANYWEDLVGVHAALGLTVRLGGAVAIAYLNPRKEKEVMVLAPQADDDFADLLFVAITALRKEWGVLAFSTGIMFPELGTAASARGSAGAEAGAKVTQPSGERSLPAMARVVDRGSPTSPRADVSALELFACTNSVQDPLQLARVLRREVDSFKKSAGRS